MNSLDRNPAAVLIAAALITLILLAALLDVTARAMQPVPDPAPPPVEVEGERPWAGWWLDDGWTVGEDGALVGNTADVQGYPVENHHLRYAFPPADAPDADYRADFDLEMARGTLYVGVRAAWHPAQGGDMDCGALVFPLNNRLSARAVQVSACRMAGILNPAAALERPRWDATEWGGATAAITVQAEGSRAQLIMRGQIVYGVDAPRDRGGLYFALAPQTEARLSPPVWSAAQDE